MSLRRPALATDSATARSAVQRDHEDQTMATNSRGRRALPAPLVVAVVVASIGLSTVHWPIASAKASDAVTKPTVVLVHGAWDRASSWNPVAARLRDDGYRVVVPDNPLRTLAGDAAFIARVLARIDGPIVLVGHSYGGSVITNAAEGNLNVDAMVYVAAFAPDRGESAFGLGARIPGSLLPASLVPVPFIGAHGETGVDLYINPLLFRAVLAHDLSPREAAAMAAAQRPVTLRALIEQSQAAAWKRIPSWYAVARNDRAIAPATQRFMARRARASTVEIASSHAALVAQPDAVTKLILDAARSDRQVPPPPRVAKLPTSSRTVRAPASRYHRTQ